MTTMMKMMMPQMSHYWASELTWTHCPWNPSLLEIDTCHLSFLFLVSFGHLVMTIMMTTMVVRKLLDSIWIRCCRIKWYQHVPRKKYKSPELQKTWLWGIALDQVFFAHLYHHMLLIENTRLAQQLEVGYSLAPCHGEWSQEVEQSWARTSEHRAIQNVQRQTCAPTYSK